ncbi:MAG: hypothetical protein HY828_01235 [Actinobacteria bacterium]|nr:hypothetical protein [Actinomycetota bacterium]
MSTPFDDARTALQRVAVHVIARARIEHSGRFSLRVTPGGFGTPDLGTDGRRVRVSGTHLVVESDQVGAASVATLAIDGASLAQLAAAVGVDLGETIDVGHDTPPLGDIDAPMALDPAGALELVEWFGQTAAILDRVLAALPSHATPTLPRLWPEHFDVAVEAQATAERRVNLGGSPGDAPGDQPYLYVGPWTADRPGDSDFWNAPYGAKRTFGELAADPAGVIGAGAAFLLDGYERLR